MFETLWDLIEQQIRADGAAPPPSRDTIAAQSGTKVTSLEQRYERLRLTNMAIWEILKRRLGVSDLDLAREVQALVSDAGAHGGTVRARQVTECPACHRNVLASATACIYCGAPLVPASGFGGT